MTKPTELEALTQQLLDLWQQQLNTPIDGGGEQVFATWQQDMAKLMQGSLDAEWVQNWQKTMTAMMQNQTDDKQSKHKDAHGAAATAAAPDLRDLMLLKFGDRLASLEERLVRLEAQLKTNSD